MCGGDGSGRAGERHAQIGNINKTRAPHLLQPPPLPTLPFQVSFLAAFGIGANDVANSFASSVGARALSLPAALAVAAVFEFSGAVLLGAMVTETVQGGIVDTAVFAGTPDLFLFGFFCVVCAAAVWDNAASQLALPVSTTHTTVAATVGMALALHGGAAVQWVAPVPDFPYVGGVVPILASWVLSPLVAGAFVAALFGGLRAFVLRSPASFTRALCVLPGLVGLLFFTAAVTVAQTFYKNRGGLGPGRLPRHQELTSVWIGLGVGGGACVVAAALAAFVLKPRVEAAERRAADAVAARRAALAEAARVAAVKGRPPPTAASMADMDAAADWGPPSAFSQKCAAAWNNFRATRVGALVANNAAARLVSHGVTYRVHDELETDDRVAEVWESAEVFDFKTERLFRHLQVLTACAMAFAHGSNDVSNAMGPFSAVVQTWRTGAVPVREAAVPVWILVLGGAGIVTGLAVFGYKVLAVLAVRSVKLTNARGACVELASALTVILASRFGLPVSTTQVVCGAVLTVGLMEGAKGVNW